MAPSRCPRNFLCARTCESQTCARENTSRSKWPDFYFIYTLYYLLVVRSGSKLRSQRPNRFQWKHGTSFDPNTAVTHTGLLCSFVLAPKSEIEAEMLRFRLSGRDPALLQRHKRLYCDRSAQPDYLQVQMIFSPTSCWGDEELKTSYAGTWKQSWKPFDFLLKFKLMFIS